MSQDQRTDQGNPLSRPVRKGAETRFEDDRFDFRNVLPRHGHCDPRAHRFTVEYDLSDGNPSLFGDVTERGITVHDRPGNCRAPLTLAVPTVIIQENVHRQCGQSGDALETVGDVARISMGKEKRRKDGSGGF